MSCKHMPIEVALFPARTSAKPVHESQRSLSGASGWMTPTRASSQLEIW